jgi:hypothetical protein
MPRTGLAIKNNVSNTILLKTVYSKPKFGVPPKIIVATFRNSTSEMVETKKYAIQLPICSKSPIACYREMASGRMALYQVCECNSSSLYIPSVIYHGTVERSAAEIGILNEREFKRRIFVIFAMLDGSVISCRFKDGDEYEVVQEVHPKGSQFTIDLLDSTQLPLAVMCGRVVIFNSMATIATYKRVEGYSFYRFENFSMVACRMTGLPPYIASFGIGIPHLASWRIEQIKDSLFKSIILTIDDASDNTRHMVHTYAISDGSKKVKQSSHATEIQELVPDSDDRQNMEYDSYVRSMATKVPRTMSRNGVKHCQGYEKGRDNVVSTVSMAGVESIDIDYAFPDLLRVGS